MSETPRPKEPRYHLLKLSPKYFSLVKENIKTFEIRRNDRHYQVEDILVLREWSESTGYSGNFCVKRVTYMFSDNAEYCLPSMAILAIKPYTMSDSDLEHIKELIRND